MQNILDTIGNTPLLQLKKIGGGKIFVKLEYYNPSGSIKDRAIAAMVLDAEKRGLIKPGDTLVEPTSGNTGIALSLIGAVRGYKVKIAMPCHASMERKRIAEAFGAQVICTRSEEGLEGTLRVAKELAKEPNHFMLNQFVNPANTLAQRGLGEEIAAELDKVSAFVAGVGTGGTLMGAGQVLKGKYGTKMIAVEPAKCTALVKGPIGPHKIEGIGDGFIPELVDTSKIDDVILVDDDDAFEMARRLTKEEGVFGGASSGANVWAALQLIDKMDGPIVTVIPDGGFKYLSTGMFEG